MSMGTSVEGIRPPDDKWRKMNSVREACICAKVPIPRKVDEFFEFTSPDPAGVKVDLSGCSGEWTDKSCQGIEIDVKKLPKDVTIIRFKNCW